MKLFKQKQQITSGRHRLRKDLIDVFKNTSDLLSVLIIYQKVKSNHWVKNNCKKSTKGLFCSVKVGKWGI